MVLFPEALVYYYAFEKCRFATMSEMPISHLGLSLPPISCFRLLSSLFLSPPKRLSQQNEMFNPRWIYWLNDHGDGCPLRNSLIGKAFTERNEHCHLKMLSMIATALTHEKKREGSIFPQKKRHVLYHSGWKSLLKMSCYTRIWNFLVKYRIDFSRQNWPKCASL